MFLKKLFLGILLGFAVQAGAISLYLYSNNEFFGYLVPLVLLLATIIYLCIFRKLYSMSIGIVIGWVLVFVLAAILFYGA